MGEKSHVMDPVYIFCVSSLNTIMYMAGKISGSLGVEVWWGGWGITLSGR